MYYIYIVILILMEIKTMSDLIYNQVSPMELQAREWLETLNAVVIADSITYEQAGAKLKELKQYTKTIKDNKTTDIKPLKDGIKKLEDKYNKPLAILAEADAIIREKMNKYLNEEIKMRAEAEAEAKRQAEEIALKRALELEEAKKEASKYDPITARAMVNSLEDQQNELINQTAKVENINLSTDNNIVSKVWDFELVDISSVPLEFITLNDKAVRQAIREGVREIKGLKIYQKARVSIR